MCMYRVRERAALIKDLFDVKLSVSTLMAFYKVNKVKYRANKRVYKSSLIRMDELEERRCEFAKELAKLIVEGRRIIYCDESSINNWCSKPRSWSL